MILITRPQPDSDKDSEMLNALGYQTITDPMLDIVPVSFTLPDLSPYKGIICTSKHAVRMLTDKIEIGNICILAVGPKTASEAAEKGFQNIRTSNGTAKGLQTYIETQYTSQDRFLYVHGEHTSHPLDKNLEKKGYIVDSVVVYTARNTQSVNAATVDHIKKNRIDAVTFFSKRTAETFLSLAQSYGLIPHLNGIKALCISAKVQKSVQPYFAYAYASQEPTAEGMLNLIRHRCDKKGDKNNEYKN